MVDVSLGPSELTIAAGVGVQRAIESLASGKRPAFGMRGEDAWRSCIEGAAGEMAVAKVMSIYWSGPESGYRKGDGDQKYQVRTRSRHGAELIIRDPDRDEDAYILVTGCAPHFTVVGWCFGWEAKRTEFVQAPAGRPPAYFVPTDALRDLSELRDVIANDRGAEGWA